MQKEFKRVQPNNDSSVEAIYNRLYSIYKTSESADVLKEIGTIFTTISDYKDSKKLAIACFRKAQNMQNDEIYYRALSLYERDDINSIKEAMREFEKIRTWKDSAEKINSCNYRINMLKRKLEIQRLSQNYDENNGGSEIHKIFFVGILLCALIVALMWIWKIFSNFN